MISLPNPKTFSTQIMTDSDLRSLKSRYANYIIDGMDMDCLCQLAYDLLLEAYEDYTEEQLKTEIVENYDEETLDDLMGED